MCTEWGDAAMGFQPTSCEAPPKVAKRGRKSEIFEDKLLGQLKQKTTENEAFGMSIGLSLDRMPKNKAAKCKAQMMGLLADFEKDE